MSRPGGNVTIGAGIAAAASVLAMMGLVLGLVYKFRSQRICMKLDEISALTDSTHLISERVKVLEFADGQTSRDMKEMKRALERHEDKIDAAFNRLYDRIDDLIEIIPKRANDNV